MIKLFCYQYDISDFIYINKKEKNWQIRKISLTANWSLKTWNFMLITINLQKFNILPGYIQGINLTADILFFFDNNIIAKYLKYYRKCYIL